MFSLPDSEGDGYPVGATTFASPVRQPLTIGSARLRSGEPALVLDEIAFTAYYPADTTGISSRTKGEDWLIRPVYASFRGLVNFARVSAWIIWPLVYVFGRLVKIPVYRNSPLLHPSTSSKTGRATPQQWPLVIFSHGLGGSRTAYSQICTRLAASGKVVLAIEHRDSTGHACVSRTWLAEGKYKPRTILYLPEEEVEWGPEGPTNVTDAMRPLPIRTDQLVFRHHELHLVYTAFSRLVQSDGNLEIEVLDAPGLDLASWSALEPITKRRPVDCEAGVCLAGHSFGGSTVFSLMSSGSSPYPPIPATHCLILDPWLEPLPSPGAVTLPEDFKSDAHDGPQLLVINSEVFTLWKDHFEQLSDVVSAWNPPGRLMTLVRSQHASFSDFPLLPVIRRHAAQRLMEITAQISVAFLDGHTEDVLEKHSTRKMEVEIIGKKADGRPKRRIMGTLGDIVIH